MHTRSAWMSRQLSTNVRQRQDSRVRVTKKDRWGSGKLTVELPWEVVGSQAVKKKVLCDGSWAGLSCVVSSASTGKSLNFQRVQLTTSTLGTRHTPGSPSTAATDRASGTTLGHNGRSNHARSYLVGWIRGLGCKRVFAGCNNEPAMLELLREVNTAMPEVKGQA